MNEGKRRGSALYRTGDSSDAVQCKQAKHKKLKRVKQLRAKMGPHRESNPGPLAPEVRIIPLDHEATTNTIHRIPLINAHPIAHPTHRIAQHTPSDVLNNTSHTTLLAIPHTERIDTATYSSSTCSSSVVLFRSMDATSSS